MANINPKGYYKIGVYNLVVLVVYFLFSLPMSYIKHYKLDFVNTEQMKCGARGGVGWDVLRMMLLLPGWSFLGIMVVWT